MVRVRLIDSLRLVMWGWCLVAAATRKKKNKQEIKFRGLHPGATVAAHIGLTDALYPDESMSAIDNMAKSKASRDADQTSGASISVATQIDGQSISVNVQNQSDLEELLATRVCPANAKDIHRYTTTSFWRGSYIDAYLCATQMVNMKLDNGLTSAILYFLTQTKYSPSINAPKVRAPAVMAPSLSSWDILGPFPVSKLEVDGDPTFDNHETMDNFFDPIVAVLGMNSTSSKYFSELASGGQVKWSTANAKLSNDQVDVKFPVSWNELGQALSDTAVFEFQGWARATTYAHISGQYLVQCVGVHSAYVRNENMTRLLTGDVYKSGRIASFVDLKVGPVGIVLPLRGAGHTSFSCSVTYHADSSLLLFPITKIPDLLELEQAAVAGKLKSTDDKIARAYGAGSAMFSASSVKTTIGIMLSKVFALTLQNPSSNPISVVDIQLSKHSQQIEATRAKLGVRQARALRTFSESEDNNYEDANLDLTVSRKSALFSVGADEAIVVAPGQIITVPLELFSLDGRNKIPGDPPIL
jgi:hypothetical protein